MVFLKNNSNFPEKIFGQSSQDCKIAVQFFWFRLTRLMIDWLIDFCMYDFFRADFFFFFQPYEGPAKVSAPSRQTEEPPRQSSPKTKYTKLSENHAPRRERDRGSRGRRQSKLSDDRDQRPCVEENSDEMDSASHPPRQPLSDKNIAPYESKANSAARRTDSLEELEEKVEFLNSQAQQVCTRRSIDSFIFVVLSWFDGRWVGSIDRSIAWLIDLCIDRSLDWSIYVSIDRLIDWSTNEIVTVRTLGG